MSKKRSRKRTKPAASAAEPVVPSAESAPETNAASEANALDDTDAPRVGAQPGSAPQTVADAIAAAATQHGENTAKTGTSTPSQKPPPKPVSAADDTSDMPRAAHDSGEKHVGKSATEEPVKNVEKREKQRVRASFFDVDSSPTDPPSNADSKAESKVESKAEPMKSTPSTPPSERKASIPPNELKASPEQPHEKPEKLDRQDKQAATDKARGEDTKRPSSADKKDDVDRDDRKDRDNEQGEKRNEKRDGKREQDDDAAAQSEADEEARDARQHDSMPPSARSSRRKSGKRSYRSATMSRDERVLSDPPPKRTTSEQDESLDGGDLEDDLGHEFFAQDDRAPVSQRASDSIPPSLRPPALTRLSPLELQDRRRKMRRIVAYVLVPAAIIALIAVVKISLQKSKSPHSGIAASAQVSLNKDDIGAQPAPSQAVQPADRAAAATSAETVGEQEAAVDTAAVAELADAAEAAPPQAEQDTGAAAPEETQKPDEQVDVSSLRKDAEKALNMGKWDDAISLCQKALAHDPEDARLYLYYGTALQEKGDRPKAAEVFKQCVEKATRGPKHECRMFAR